MEYLKPENCSLVLRACAADMTSHGGFRWPSEIGAAVEFADWNPEAVCGGGGHGWLFGQGDHGCSNYVDNEDAKWLVVEVASDTIIELGGKVKFPRGVVRFVGNRSEAAAFILEHEARAKTCAVIGAVLAVGDGEVVAVGALGTATAGYSGTATAGYSGTATAGDSGTICIRWWDDKNSRHRASVGYVGEDGIEANVAYRLDSAGKFVKAEA